MKKKLIIMLSIVAVLACIFAITAFAAEPDTSRETVTLNDGTECALWDTAGNPLIWYVTGTDDSGAKTYAYIDATDAGVDYYASYTSSTGGVTWYQLTTITIIAGDKSYGQSSIAVLNMKSDDLVFTSGKAESYVGKPVNCFSKVFTGSSNLEYAYLPLCMVDLNGENFKNCKSLKYVNLPELTELREIGSQDFNLGEVKSFFENKVLDLSNTKLTKIEGNGFACCSATQIILPETLTSVGADAFKNCKYATKITFNGTLTSVSTSNLFNGCIALEEIEGFVLPAGTTSIGGSAFRYCHKLYNAGDFIVDGVIYFPEGINKVDTFAFSECKSIVAIIFPSTINTINQQGFSYMDNVEIISFDKKDAAVKAAIANGETYTPLAFGNCGHFRAAKKLVALSLPEGIIEINNRAFVECTSLTAVYMPNSVKYLNNNGQGQGPFCNSTSMYFVQESFTVSQCIVDGRVDTTKLALPEKPTVYYMPTSLEKFTGHTYTNDTYSNASMFANCTAINDVLVFPESFTSMVVMRPFWNMGTSSSQKTLVFLGNMQEFVISHQARYINFVFANENDKTFEDLGIKRTTGNSNEQGSSAYFCSTGMRYDLAISGRQGSGTDPTTEENIAKINATIAAIHATGVADESCHVRDKNKDKTSDATCTENEKAKTFCFCGFKIGSVVNENTALGHDDTDAVVIMYFANNNYFENATSEYTCKRCEEAIKSEIANSALFTKKGITVPENEKTTSICHAITVNNKAIEDYNAYLGESNAIKYGVVVGKATASGKPVNTDGTSSANAIVVGFDGTDYSHIQAKITNVPDENTGLYCSAYVIDAGVVTYLYEGSASTTAQVISLSNYNPTLPETTVSSNDEE